jgi:hypothetical protein
MKVTYTIGYTLFSLHNISCCEKVSQPSAVKFERFEEWFRNGHYPWSFLLV